MFFLSVYICFVCASLFLPLLICALLLLFFFQFSFPFRYSSFGSLIYFFLFFVSFILVSSLSSFRPFSLITSAHFLIHSNPCVSSYLVCSTLHHHHASVTTTTTTAITTADFSIQPAPQTIPFPLHC